MWHYIRSSICLDDRFYTLHMFKLQLTHRTSYSSYSPELQITNSQYIMIFTSSINKSYPALFSLQVFLKSEIIVLRGEWRLCNVLHLKHFGYNIAFSHTIPGKDNIFNELLSQNYGIAQSQLLIALSELTHSPYNTDDPLDWVNRCIIAQNSSYQHFYLNIYTDVITQFNFSRNCFKISLFTKYKVSLLLMLN